MKKIGIILISFLLLAIGAIATANVAVGHNHLALGVAAVAVGADRSRAIWNKLNVEYGHVNTPAPSFLRIEQTLNSTNGSYNFNLKVDSGTIATENKLDRNDIFVTEGIMLGISAQTPATQGKEVIQTYPNSVVFAAANVTGLVAADLEAIYNGYLKLKIGSKVNIEKLPLLHFRRVPVTQQASVVAATAAIPSSGFANSEFGMETLSYKPGTLIYLRGTDNIELNVTFPTYAGMSIQNTGYPASLTVIQTKLVMLLYGYLIVGGANAQPKRIPTKNA